MEFQLTPTVLWAIFGIILCAAEIISFSFVLIFFGIAAFLVAGFRLLGLDHLVTEIFIFSFLSVLGILMFRSRLVGLKQKKNNFTDIDQKIVLNIGVAAGKTARIQYQGTSWTAHNLSARDLLQGETVVIERVEGIHLYLNIPVGTESTPN
jgi:membrane protein implicated in regulation of membrane protease activity